MSEKSEFFLDILTVEDETTNLACNICNQIPSDPVLYPRSMYT
jgi:hypothetical protein